MGYKYNSVAAMRDAISRAYRQAVQNTRDNHPAKRTFSNPSLIAVDENEQRIDGIDDVYYSGKPVTKGMVAALIKDPRVHQVWYDNGIDYAETYAAFREGRFERGEHASVLLWER